MVCKKSKPTSSFRIREYRQEQFSGQDFARRKRLWHLQVAEDKTLSETAYRIAMVLPKWLNARSEEAYPSQQTVANLLSVSDRSVRKCLKELHEAGHLSKRPGKRGPLGTNTYKMEVHFDGEMRNSHSSTHEENPELRNGHSPSTGINSAKNEERTFRRTIERTSKKQTQKKRAWLQKYLLSMTRLRLQTRKECKYWKNRFRDRSTSMGT